MKRLLSAIVIGVMVAGSFGTVAAQEVKVEVTKTEVTAVPVLISVNELPFTVEQEGDDFTILVEENASTGYTWSYTINDETSVAFVSDETSTSTTDFLGAPSMKKVSFQVLKEGVSTITFEYKRNFADEDVAESFDVLVYKSGDTVIIEEDKVVYAMDTAVPTLYEIGEAVMYDGENVEADVDVQVIGGITMVPLRATLEAMGYTVTWNAETASVDIMQGAQWTSIAIGKNAYFRNRMAPWSLSAAPVIVNDRTLVPVEFFAEIMGKGITVDNGTINFSDFEGAIHEGYVQAVSTDETGAMTITLSTEQGSEDLMNHTIIHTSKATTLFQKEVVIDDRIKVVSSAVMTMSIPGQTSGYVIY